MAGQSPNGIHDARIAWLPAPARAFSALLVVVRWCAFPWVLAVGLLFAEDPIPLSALIVSLATFSLVPAASFVLVDRWFTARVETKSGTLCITGRAGEAEVPVAAIASIEPWRVPLPGSGLVIRTRGGRRLTLRNDGIAAWLDALLGAGCEPARAARARAEVAFAEARQGVRGAFWRRTTLRFVFVVLPVTLVAFNAHQHIAYGGALGQYYLEGFVPFLRTLSEYALTASLYVLLYASTWRIAIELASFAATRIAPSRAATVRRVAEITSAIAVYAGVPALLALRFLA